MSIIAELILVCAGAGGVYYGLKFREQVKTHTDWIKHLDKRLKTLEKTAAGAETSVVEIPPPTPVEEPAK